MQSDMSTTLDTRKLMKELTIHINMTHAKEAGFRLWLARHLFEFAAWIGGFGAIEVEK